MSTQIIYTNNDLHSDLGYLDTQSDPCQTTLKTIIYDFFKLYSWQEADLEALRSSLHPVEILLKKAKLFGHDIKEKDFAIQMDSVDPVRHLRQEFHYPKSIDLPEGNL